MKRALRVLVGVLVVAIVASAVLGYQLFTRDHQDPLRKVDAIVVLGGEHDGREAYGIELARRGYADHVLISDPYRPYTEFDAMMPGACSAGTATITVTCFEPEPSTTRGEAMYVRQMAREHNWDDVIVISWSYHLVRARFIFGQCFDGDVVMHAVPRDYSANPVLWAGVYAYQYGGLAKAAVLGC
ncbi:YdcF family protein [Gordonia sp. JH63]|uniref:YdcF family protein n=1 Tax=Gordonia sp. JH63 TaxID=2698900 RepID=UPI0013205135|nr:YdcF family protein [Gordonia sp. JH63]QHD84815.1 YdcF family protein [Gordonia sp. JH63]